jgi:hypothetical protein
VSSSAKVPVQQTPGPKLEEGDKRKAGRKLGRERRREGGRKEVTLTSETVKTFTHDTLHSKMR